MVSGRISVANDLFAFGQFNTFGRCSFVCIYFPRRVRIIDVGDDDVFAGGQTEIFGIGIAFKIIVSSEQANLFGAVVSSGFEVGLFPKVSAFNRVDIVAVRSGVQIDV